MRILPTVISAYKHGVGNIKRFENEFVSRPLPLLRRSFISFHQLCGNRNASAVDGPFACSITVEKDQIHTHDECVDSKPKKKFSSFPHTPKTANIRKEIKQLLFILCTNKQKDLSIQ